jgi:hypothetical protein
MKTPSYDETMNLLGGIQETYSWLAFKAILDDPAKLKAWIQEELKSEPDEPMDPEDPRVGEGATVQADTEQNAMDFWGELTKEEQEKIRAAFLDLWGKEGLHGLPMSLR